jgi:hypothetical protein
MIWRDSSKSSPDKFRNGNRILYRVTSEAQKVVAGTQHGHGESEGRPKSRTKAGDVAYNALGRGTGHPVQLQEVHCFSDASPFLPGSLDLESSRTPDAWNLHKIKVKVKVKIEVKVKTEVKARDRQTTNGTYTWQKTQGPIR